MKVNSIELNNFRNLSSIHLSAESGVNVIYGENAQGKTNIIEGIWLFTGLKSFRGSKDNELIKFNENFSKISLDFNDSVRNKNCEILISEKKRNISLNGVPLKSSRELMGNFYAVIFSPDHLSLIKDGPGERRKFIDSALCQLKPSYVQALSSFKRILVQRNSLLKDIYLNSGLYDVLDTYDEQLAKFSSYIIKERIKYINLLSEYSKEIYAGISEQREEIGVKYSFTKNSDENLSIEDIFILQKEKIKNSRKEDILNKTTSVGPHRDDIEIFINDICARTYGSQGQQRSCALALKLGESEIVKKITGETPVALLDDVMSELDEKRQNYILNHIKDRQVFLTCCDPSQVLRLWEGKSFLIKGGEII